MRSIYGTPPAYFAVLFHLWLVMLLACTPVSFAQSTAKDRQDEKREDERVEKARKELSQTQAELKKLQDQLQQRSKAFVAARAAFIQSKKKSEETLEDAQQRVGETLGIPAQMQVIRGASLLFQDKTKGVLEKLKSTAKYAEIDGRINTSEEALKNGIHPVTQLTILSDQIEEIEAQMAIDKKSLRTLEDEAIAADPEARIAKQDLDEALEQLRQMKSKLSPARIDNDFAYKKAKSDTDQALKKMQTASAGLKQAEAAMKKKASEVGADYQAYMKAKQADAADSNRSKPTPKKPPPKTPPPKKPTPQKTPPKKPASKPSTPNKTPTKNGSDKKP